ncbi:MAG TPA: zinc ribbon domain-containing protein [Anaerolineales bacterium]
MSSDAVDNRLQCPNCGASIRPDQSICPACGAPVSPSDMASRSREKASQMIRDANQNLVQAGAGAAESAFGLGCSLGVLLGLALLALIFILGSRNWILLGLVAIGAALFAAGASAIISARAKSATMAGTYARDVEPEIEKTIQSNRFTRQEFDALANEILDKNAPLRRYLSLPPETESANSETQDHEF